MPTAEAGPGLSDSHGVGAAVAAMGSSARRAGRYAFAVLLATLDSGEQVEILGQCRFLGNDGVIALTERRLLVANAREWDPDVVAINIQPGLTVQGWQDEKSAALVFSNPDGDDIVVDRFSDRSVAMRLVEGYRARVG